MVEERPNPVAVFVCGVMSILLCGFFTGMPAIIMGNRGLQWEYADSISESDLALIKAGRILGIIGTIWCCAGLLLWVTVLQNDPRLQKDSSWDRYYSSSVR